MLIVVSMDGLGAIFSAILSENSIQIAPASKYPPAIFKAPQLRVPRQKGNERLLIKSPHIKSCQVRLHINDEMPELHSKQGRVPKRILLSVYEYAHGGIPYP